MCWNDYVQLVFTCSNYEEDVWRGVGLLAVTISVFSVVGWLVFRVMKRFSGSPHGR